MFALGTRELVFEFFEFVAMLFTVLVRVDELQVEAPVGRTEAPVTDARLVVLVRVHDKVLRREEQVARVALDALAVGVRVELHVDDAVGAPEATVKHFENVRAATCCQIGRIAQLLHFT
jgi:hypothetical protein